MNQLINTHYASVDEGVNEYRIYECRKNQGRLKYIAVIHSSLINDITDEKLLLEKIPCAMPQSWSLKIIKKLDNSLSRLQLLPNSDLSHLVFQSTHKDHVSKKVEEIILNINKAYLQLES